MFEAPETAKYEKLAVIERKRCEDGSMKRHDGGKAVYEGSVTRLSYAGLGRPYIQGINPKLPGKSAYAAYGTATAIL